MIVDTFTTEFIRNVGEKGKIKFSNSATQFMNQVNDQEIFLLKTKKTQYNRKHDSPRNKDSCINIKQKNIWQENEDLKRKIDFEEKREQKMLLIC